MKSTPHKQWLTKRAMSDWWRVIKLSLQSDYLIIYLSGLTNVWFKGCIQQVLVFKKLLALNCPYILSPPCVLCFLLLSEWIMLFSYSLVQINGYLHMGPHKPPRFSSKLCHCHGDSSERPHYIAGLVTDTQCFLVVPQAHMDTYTDSSLMKGIKAIDSSFSQSVQLFCLFSFHTVIHLDLNSSTFIFLAFWKAPCYRQL